MTVNESDSPKPQRRWYQFRRRTLLILVLVCAACCSISISKLLSATLDDTQVTDEGIRKLQEALPNCEIYH